MEADRPSLAARNAAGRLLLPHLCVTFGLVLGVLPASGCGQGNGKSDSGLGGTASGGSAQGGRSGAGGAVSTGGAVPCSALIASAPFTAI